MNTKYEIVFLLFIVRRTQHSGAKLKQCKLLYWHNGMENPQFRMKLFATKFKSGGLHEKQVVATWNVGNHLSICF